MRWFQMNITINYEGQSKRVASFFAPSSDFFASLYSAITVKVRANMPFTKIFQAAEVRGVHVHAG